MPINITIYSDVWFTDCLSGGRSNPPPLYFLILIQICYIWYVFGKSLGSTSIIAEKACLLKSKYFLRSQVKKQKMCGQKNYANCNKLYIFEKSVTERIQMCKTFAKLKPKCVFKKNGKCENSL